MFPADGDGRENCTADGPVSSTCAIRRQSRRKVIDAHQITIAADGKCAGISIQQNDRHARRAEFVDDLLVDRFTIGRRFQRREENAVDFAVDVMAAQSPGGIGMIVIRPAVAPQDRSADSPARPA